MIERRLSGFGEWALRVAVACEFAGHGIEALGVKASWIPFFTTFGFAPETARALMPFFGVLDLALALTVLIRPIPAVLLWMVFWGFFTALLRPLSGQSIVEFIERGANWGAPLALFILCRRRLYSDQDGAPIPASPDSQASWRSRD